MGDRIVVLRPGAQATVTNLCQHFDCDVDGVQLEDEETMRLEALEMVTNLSEEAHITGMDWSGWRVIVRDGNGCECFEVKF